MLSNAHDIDDTVQTQNDNNGKTTTENQLVTQTCFVEDPNSYKTLTVTAVALEGNFIQYHR